MIEEYLANFKNLLDISLPIKESLQGPNILDGKEYANNLLLYLKKLNLSPALHVIQVGNHEPSNIYIQNKKEKLAFIGGKLIQHKLPEHTDSHELKNLIKNLSKDPLVDGILLQLPLPKELNSRELLESIDPNKDVDGLTYQNQSHLIQSQSGNFLPCTPLGILLLLKKLYKSDLKGLTVMLLGRSQLVGKPLGLMLQAEGASLIWCHSETKESLFHQASTVDVVISATGREVLKTEQLPNEGVLIDVGIWVDQSGQVRGDFKNHTKLPVKYVTPVPGGIGPLTVASLCLNICKKIIDKNIQGEG